MRGVESTAELLEELKARHGSAVAPQAAPPAQEDERAEAATLHDGWGKRRRRNKATQSDMFKNAARSVLFTASSGETIVCEHDKRGNVRVNAHGTVLVVRFGTEQVRVSGRRLNLLRDAFEAHRVDDVRPALRPELDVTAPDLEHIEKVSIGHAEEYAFDAQGAYTPLAEG